MNWIFFIQTMPRAACITRDVLTAPRLPACMSPLRALEHLLPLDRRTEFASSLAKRSNKGMLLKIGSARRGHEAGGSEARPELPRMGLLLLTILRHVLDGRCRRPHAIHQRGYPATAHYRRPP
jgi:hypothetical protein